MDKFQRNQIRSLIQDDRFRAIEHLKNEVIMMYQGQSIKSDDEFNTIWRIAQREAKIEGLHEFFKRLIQEASEE